MKIIEQNIDRIIALCKKYKVDKLWIFGSILTPRFNERSDIDFSVTFHYHQIEDMFITFFDFIDELKTLLGREIDMVDESAIRNPYFRAELDSTKRLIYAPYVGSFKSRLSPC
ncbi:MAG: nucleotidyltransferase domain-containing protein [Muribaculaceae bacterium]|nr:nucleotidyltransferase domain-containing protein [Muribaculaceae bacterium]